MRSRNFELHLVWNVISLLRTAGKWRYKFHRWLSLMTICQVKHELKVLSVWMMERVVYLNGLLLPPFSFRICSLSVHRPDPRPTLLSFKFSCFLPLPWVNQPRNLNLCPTQALHPFGYGPRIHQNPNTQRLWARLATSPKSMIPQTSRQGCTEWNLLLRWNHYANATRWGDQGPKSCLSCPHRATIHQKQTSSSWEPSLLTSPGVERTPPVTKFLGPPSWRVETQPGLWEFPEVPPRNFHWPLIGQTLSAGCTAGKHSVLCLLVCFIFFLAGPISSRVLQVKDRIV